MKEGILLHPQLACADSLADSDGLYDNMANTASPNWPYTAIITASSPVGLTSSVVFPLKSALKSTRDLTKDVKPARTVSFIEPVKPVPEDVGRALTKDDVEVMKLAVVEMGGHTEELVQLAIEIQSFLHEDAFLFGSAAELCLRADVLAEDPLMQEDFRSRITQIKKKLDEEEGEEVRKIPDNGSSVDDNNNDNNENDNEEDDTNNVKNIGAYAEQEPFAGMPEDAQLSATRTSSTSSSSSSNVCSFASASLPASSSSPSIPSFASFDAPTPLSLETVASSLTAASLFPSLFALAPSSPTPSSAPCAAPSSSPSASSPSTAGVAAPRETSGCLLSGMSGDACHGLDKAANSQQEEGPAQARGQGDVETILPEARGHMAAEEASDVTVAAALSSLAQSPAEMSEEVGAEARCRDAQMTSGSSATRPQGNSYDSGSRGQTVERLKALARDNRRLKERKMCRACKQVDLSESGITFLPCGHFITCEICSEKFDDCPACGKNIMGTVRTFLS